MCILMIMPGTNLRILFLLAEPGLLQRRQQLQRQRQCLRREPVLHECLQRGRTRASDAPPFGSEQKKTFREENPRTRRNMHSGPHVWPRS